MLILTCLRFSLPFKPSNLRKKLDKKFFPKRKRKIAYHYSLFILRKKRGNYLLSLFLRLLLGIKRLWRQHVCEIEIYWILFQLHFHHKTKVGLIKDQLISWVCILFINIKLIWYWQILKKLMDSFQLHLTEYCLVILFHKIHTCLHLSFPQVEWSGWLLMPRGYYDMKACFLRAQLWSFPYWKEPHSKYIRIRHRKPNKCTSFWLAFTLAKKSCIIF